MKSESGSKINSRDQAGGDEGGSQHGWLRSRVRRTGMLALICAAVLAVYSVAGRVLRSTVIHLASRISDQEILATANISPAACMAYWLFFAITIILALYMAVLDVRGIRSRYTAQRHELIMRAAREGYRYEANEPKDPRAEPE